MNYSGLNLCDTANGDGVRVSLFVSGCYFHCKGCFNQSAWDFNAGNPFTTETIQTISKELSKSYISGLSLLGGDPLCQSNEGLEDLILLCDYTHSIGKTVFLWSGFTYKWIQEHGTNLQQELLSKADVFIDGQYDESLRDVSLKWRGSSNQKIYYPRKTLDK